MCFWVNLDSHSSHANGFSPVWVLHVRKQEHLAQLLVTIWRLLASLASSVPAVHLECRVLGKSGPAVAALKRLGPCVCPLMQQQGSFGAESLPTVSADMSHSVTFMYLKSRGNERRIWSNQGTLYWTLVLVCSYYKSSPVLYGGQHLSSFWRSSRRSRRWTASRYCGRAFRGSSDCYG